jgi:hypothetical protein
MYDLLWHSNSLYFLHAMYLCVYFFVWFSQQIPITRLNSINRLVFQYFLWLMNWVLITYYWHKHQVSEDWMPGYQFYGANVKLTKSLHPCRWSGLREREGLFVILAQTVRTQFRIFKIWSYSVCVYHLPRRCVWFIRSQRIMGKDSRILEVRKNVGGGNTWILHCLKDGWV